MLWANDRIRLQFYGAFAGKPPILGKALDTRKTIDYGNEFEIKSNSDLDTVDFNTFNKSTGFKTMYETSFHDDLLGMKTLGILMSCEKSYDKDAYNGWNMSTPELWDHAWFNAQDN